jgi:hypothetical protein
MRLTSSAMEMPRRFASRLRNALCGSVNEIICLVIGLFTADLVLAPSGGSKNPNHVWSDVWVCPYERGYAGADSLFMVSSSRSASAIRVHECNPAYYGGQLVARHFLRHAVSIPQGIQVGHA